MVPPVPGLWLTQTHANCECNEFVSAHNRVLGECPLPSNAGLAGVRKHLANLAKRMAVVPLTLEQALNHFRGARYTLYKNAYDSLQRKPLGRNDSTLSCFIKSEKMDPSAKTNPDPRMIQARGPRFNLHMACYVHPLERQVYTTCDWSGMRVFAKGLNSLQKAELIRAKFSLLRNPVCYSLDASRFDKHVSPQLLGEEHRFYKRVFKGDALLAMLCEWQTTNRCYTQNNVKYTAKGGRMSGDMNTALGNCILMYSMLMTVSEKLGFQPLVIDDGDDCLMLVEAEHAIKFEKKIGAEFLEFGMSIKLENMACRLEDIVFCQSKVVGDRMVRNWRKVISHGTAGVKHWSNPKLVRPMLTSVGKCELACNPGVPILQEYALALIRNGRGQQQKRLDVDSGVLLRARYEVGSDQAILNARSKPVSVQARFDFEDVWGVPVKEQLIIEDILSRWTIDDVVGQKVQLELASDWIPRHGPHVQHPLNAWWEG